MRGHVTAASIKTNLYCKETPLALFVCHEPRETSAGLWAGASAPEALQDKWEQGGKGPLMGPRSECWVRIPLILS